MSFDEPRESVSVFAQMARTMRRSAPPAGLRVLGQKEKMWFCREMTEFVIGSGEHMDLQLIDGCVSDRHCILSRRGERVMVRDTHSEHGTYIDGNRIHIAELCAGSILTVGTTTLLALGQQDTNPTVAVEKLHGASEEFVRAVQFACKIARSACNALVLGETGTGKELFARLIHEQSTRRVHPFVAVNCGAIPSELVASELFGHAKGAFTGAQRERDGIFAQAHRGTLFLDELGELPMAQQPHLLRVLETGRIRCVGGHGEQEVDVRVIAATNSNVDKIRLDLYHRIAGIVLDLPPLRHRQGDVELLLRQFLSEHTAKYGARTLAPGVLCRLSNYPWPGNVRELRQAVHRAMVIGGTELVFEDFIRVEPPHSESWVKPPKVGSYDSVVRSMIHDAVTRYGSYRAAARALGISKSSLIDRAKRYGIRSPHAR